MPFFSCFFHRLFRSCPACVHKTSTTSMACGQPNVQCHSQSPLPGQGSNDPVSFSCSNCWGGPPASGSRWPFCSIWSSGLWWESWRGNSHSSNSFWEVVWIPRQEVSELIFYFYFANLFIVRYSFLLSSPEYLDSSKMFRISPLDLSVAAGDVVLFPADKVCHRAPKGMGSTATTSPAERRVLFWFSWDGSIPSFMETLPEGDFQLNPWTLHHLLHGTNHASQREYEHSLVSCLFFLFIYFQLTSSFF